MPVNSSADLTRYGNLCLLLIVTGSCALLLFGDRFLFGQSGDLWELYSVLLMAVAISMFFGPKASPFQSPEPAASPRSETESEMFVNTEKAYDAACLSGEEICRYKCASSTCYKEVIDLCSAGKLELAERQLSAMTCARSNGLSLPKCDTHGFAQATIQACINAGDSKRAAAWCSMLKSASIKLSSQTLFNVMMALRDAADTHDAEHFLANIVADMEHADSSCYQLLFDRCMTPGEKPKIEVWLDYLANHGVEELEKGLVALIRSRSHTCRLCQAEQWLQKATDAGITVGPQLCSAMINATARIGCTEEAEKWLRKMIGSGGGTSGPDMINFTEIMAAYAEKRQLKKVTCIFQQMVEYGIRPDGACFGTIIKAHAGNGNFEGSVLWARRALEENAKLDIYAFNSIIASAARANKPELVETWLELMTAHATQPDIVSYNSVINAWAKAGNAARAERLVTLMIKSTVEPDVVTLSVSIHACARARDLQRAEALFVGIVSRGYVKPDAVSFNALIDACVKSGNLQRAEVWMSEMTKAGVETSVATCTTLLQRHARAGNLKAARRFFTRMNEVGIKANVVSYSVLIRACVKGAHVEQAEEWFHQMIQMGLSANMVAYSAILNVSAKACDYIRAERWLDHMTLNGIMPNVVCFKSLIDACAKAGEPERAEAWLNRLCEAANTDHKTWGPGRSCSFVTAAQAFSLLRTWKDVKRMFTSMEERGITMDEFILTVLLSAYWRCRPPRRDLAESAFRTHWERDLRVTAPPLRVLRMVMKQQQYDKVIAKLGIPELSDKSAGISKSMLANRQTKVG